MLKKCINYSDVIMSLMASQITGVSIVCTTLSSGTDQRKHQSFASLAFVTRIHQWQMNSPHKGPVMRKIFPFDDVIMGGGGDWLCHNGIKLHFIIDIIKSNLPRNIIPQDLIWFPHISPDECFMSMFGKFGSDNSMSVMASRITINSTVCLTACLGHQHRQH